MAVGALLLDINLAKFAQLHQIKNFEFYSGIPGSIGGAVKMNAGCYGSETKDVLELVNIITNKLMKNDKINYIRINIFPDGGISRIRVFGRAI